LARSSSLWTQLRAFAARDLLIARSYRLSLLLDAIFLVSDLALYYFISRTFLHARQADLDGAPTYFAFALVRIVIAVVLNTTTTALALRIRTEQLTGTLEAVAAQPLSSGRLALGVSGIPFLASMLRAAVYLLIALVLLNLQLGAASWPGLLAVLVVTGLAMSGVGIVCAAVTVNVKRAEMVSGLLVFGMGLLGGAVFPRSVLPGALRTIGAVVPTRFAFDGLRAALYRGHGWAVDVAALGGVAIVLLPASVFAFSVAIRAAKRSGALAEY
jgi:ABC-2 type transport system permease protein